MNSPNDPARPSPYGKWIRDRRRARGYSQRKLAHLAHTSAMTIYNVESGKTQTLQQSNHDAIRRLLAHTPEDSAEFDELREAERGKASPTGRAESGAMRSTGRRAGRGMAGAHTSADTNYVDRSQVAISIVKRDPPAPRGRARPAHLAGGPRAGQHATSPSSGPRPLLAVLLVCGCAAVLYASLPLSVGATPLADLCRARPQSSPTLDGWSPISAPDPEVPDNRTAIVMHNPRTGIDKAILNPEPSPYWCYTAPLWVPQRDQLYYLAVYTDGQRDIWHTPLTDNGPDVAPSPPPQGSGWPQRYQRNVGANCTALVWSPSTQSVTCTGA